VTTTLKHLKPEHIDDYTTNGMIVGTKLIELAEEHDLCLVCFLNYLFAFVADTIVQEQPEKINSLMSGMLDTAATILGTEVAFLVKNKEAIKPTNTMTKVVDAFIDEMSSKPKGKPN